MPPPYFSGAGKLSEETLLAKLARERKERRARIEKAAWSPPKPPPRPLPKFPPLPPPKPPEPIIVPMTLEGELKLPDITKAICTYFGVTELDLVSGRRDGSIMLARHIFIYLASHHTRLNKMQIARRLQRDRATITASLKRTELLRAKTSVETDIWAIRVKLGVAGS